MPAGSSDVGDLWYPMCAYEAAKAHAANYPARADEYGPFFREFLAGGAASSGRPRSGRSRRRPDADSDFDRLY